MAIPEAIETSLNRFIIVALFRCTGFLRTKPPYGRGFWPISGVPLLSEADSEGANPKGPTPYANKGKRCRFASQDRAAMRHQHGTTELSPNLGDGKG
jgi:hypothetical protein